MGKWQNDAMLDAALDYIINNTTTMTLCDAQPADYAAATTNTGSGGNEIATATVSGGSITKGDGDVSGRKAIVPQAADVTINSTATATHVALCSGSELLYVTTCVSQALTSGNLVTIPTWDIELRDAV